MNEHNGQNENESENPIKHATFAHVSLVEEVVIRESSERYEYGIFESVPNLQHQLFSSDGETTVLCKSAELKSFSLYKDKKQFGPKKARTPSIERERKLNDKKFKEFYLRMEDQEFRLSDVEEESKSHAENHRNLESGLNEEKLKREELEKQFLQEKAEREKLEKSLKELQDLIQESGVAKRVALYKQFKELAENTAEIHKFKFCQTLYITLSTVFFSSTPISKGVIQGNITMKDDNITQVILNVLGDLAELVPIAGTGVSIAINLINAIYKEVHDHKIFIKAVAISNILRNRFTIMLEENLNLLAAEIAIEATNKIKQDLLDRFKNDPSKVVIKQQANASKKWLDKVFPKEKLNEDQLVEKFGTCVAVYLISYLCENEKQIVKNANKNLEEQCIEIIINKAWV